MVVIVIVAILSLVVYLTKRYLWFKQVIFTNPKIATLNPIVTKQMSENGTFINKNGPFHKVIAPSCNFQQYLRYLYLSCMPYLWSVPFKVILQMISRLTNSKLTNTEKRQRLAKMVLETSLILGFSTKMDSNTYHFEFKQLRIPSKSKEDFNYFFIEKCLIEVSTETNQAELTNFFINNKEIESLDEMFSLLNTIWCVYTHTMTHIQAGNIAEINIKEVQNNNEMSKEFKSTINDMHAAVSGMNESANHYPADIWGIPRKHLQIILGFNSSQTIYNHQNIMQCYNISNFVQFTMKARKVFHKYLSQTSLSISTLSANTIFHSIDHYNMGKYFLHENKTKEFKFIDSRMITSILGDLNYDLGRWQGMKYSKCKIWQNIFKELTDIDFELANKTHMFVSV